MRKYKKRKSDEKIDRKEINREINDGEERREGTDTTKNTGRMYEERKGKHKEKK